MRAEDFEGGLGILKGKNLYVSYPDMKNQKGVILLIYTNKKFVKRSFLE